MGILNTLLQADQNMRAQYGGKNPLPGVIDRMVEKRNAKEASDELIRLMRSGNLTQPAIMEVMQRHKVSAEKAQQIFESFKTSGLLEEMAQQKRLMGQQVPGVNTPSTYRDLAAQASIFPKENVARQYDYGQEPTLPNVNVPGIGNLTADIAYHYMKEKKEPKLTKGTPYTDAKGNRIVNFYDEAGNLVKTHNFGQGTSGTGGLTPSQQINAEKLKIIKKMLKGTATPRELETFGLGEDFIKEAAQMVRDDPKSAALTADQQAQSVLDLADLMRNAREKQLSGAKEPTLEQQIKEAYPNAYKGEDGQWYLDKDGKTYRIEKE